MSSVSLPDEVRAACGWVAERARSVRVVEERIEDYAAAHRAGVADIPGSKRLTAATGLAPAAIDGALWNRGRAHRYKSLPRPRSRNTAY